MKKMRAILLHKHGSTDHLEYTYTSKPSPGPNEVLIKIRACALNHLDLWTLAGMKGVSVPLPHILGCDMAGQVAEVGPGVKKTFLGQRVIVAPGISCGDCGDCKSGWDSLCASYQILGLQRHGGYAQYAVVPVRNVIRVTKKIPYEKWAAVPLVFLTAWHVLVTRAQLKRGETVLVHAAGSGVGSAAIQIAKYLGAKVVTTVGSDKKAARAKQLKADHVINYKKKDFHEEVLTWTKMRGVDVVLEHIGPETFTKSIACLAKKGRLVTCGVTSGPSAQIDIRYIFARQLSITGCYMGGLSELLKVVKLVESGKLHPVIDEIFPLREAKKAIHRMQERANFGKIILVPNHGD